MAYVQIRKRYKRVSKSSSIPRKVKKYVESLRKKPISDAYTGSANQHLQQQQQERSEAHLNGLENDELRTPESKWVISIIENLEHARQDNEVCSWAKLSIYRIPQHLKDGRDKAYVPEIVSLGPYHRDKRSKMDRHKWRCLQCMLTRTQHNIDLYLDSMKEAEETARACYEGPISMSREEFVEMMVLDGCFVIELFRGVKEGFEKLGYHRNDPVFSMRESLHTIQRDMIMLENQIPLFILDRLLGLQLGIPDQEGRVANLALEFFGPLKPTGDPQTKLSSNKPELAQLSDHGKLHCLEVFRLSLLGSGPKPEPLEQNWRLQTPQQLIHSVTELRDAGIKFSKSETDGLWDIKFEGGTLRIPRLLIHDGTRSLFLNLMAFEQSDIDCSNDITSYVIFMDNLINSAEDVGYLHKCGIIEHWLGSNAEVADLFNRLCQDVVFDINNSYLSKLSEKVNRHYGRRCNAWRASLKHNYFSNPWSIFSFVAASVLLLLTLAQTFYAVYGYYWPGS